MKAVGSTLNADETDLLVELFGAYTALLAFYYKTPERAKTYFDFSMLPYNQPSAATGTSAGDTQPLDFPKTVRSGHHKPPKKTRGFVIQITAPRVFL